MNGTKSDEVHVSGVQSWKPWQDFFFGDRESEQWELFHDNTQQMRRKVVGGVEGSGEPF